MPIFQIGNRRKIFFIYTMICILYIRYIYNIIYIQYYIYILLYIYYYIYITIYIIIYIYYIILYYIILYIILYYIILYYIYITYILYYIYMLHIYIYKIIYISMGKQKTLHHKPSSNKCCQFLAVSGTRQKHWKTGRNSSPSREYVGTSKPNMGA